MRDVCDAIIVHALRQHDVTPTETLTPSLALSAQPRLPTLSDSHEPSQLHTSGSPSRAVDSKAHSTDDVSRQSALQLDQSKLRFNESSNSQQISRLTDSVLSVTRSPPRSIDSKPHTIDSSQYSPSRLNDSPSRLTDSSPHSTDSSRRSPSRVTDYNSQANDMKTKHSELEVTEPQSHSGHYESCINDFEPRMTESKPCVSDSQVDQIPFIVSDTTTTTTTTTTTISSGGNGDMIKSEVDIADHEVDDVDMDDQPLCIDLNRDASPDDDTVGDRHSPPTPHTDTSAY